MFCAPVWNSWRRFIHPNVDTVSEETLLNKEVKAVATTVLFEGIYLSVRTFFSWIVHIKVIMTAIKAKYELFFHELDKTCHCYHPTKNNQSKNIKCRTLRFGTVVLYPHGYVLQIEGFLEVTLNCEFPEIIVAVTNRSHSTPFCSWVFMTVQQTVVELRYN